MNCSKSFTLFCFSVSGGTGRRRRWQGKTADEILFIKVQTHNRKRNGSSPSTTRSSLYLPECRPCHGCQLFTVSSLGRHGLNPRPIYARFIVDKVALGKCSYKYFCVHLSVSFHQNMLHSHTDWPTADVVGRDGSVGTATRYGLEGPEIESRWGWDFPNPSRPILGSIQPTAERITGHRPGVKRSGRGVNYPTLPP